MDVNFYIPTRVIMGVGCINKQKECMRGLGKKAMLVTGRNSAKANGSQDDVIQALTDLGIDYVVYDRVMSNPTIECVYEGAALAKKEQAEFIISIGGGSPMDAGKAIALLAAQEVSRENLFSGQYERKVLPMVHIPTTAGTGSEVTQYAILTNDKAQTKTSMASPVLFPTIAFCDPTYMNSLSKTVTINTAIDALSHAVEGMLSKRSTILTDALAKESISYIMKNLDILKADSLSLEQRGELLYASTLAGMVIAHTGTTAVHSMGYSLTYFRDIDHGRANGLLLASFLDFVKKSDDSLAERVLSAMKLSSVDEFSGVLDELLGEKEIISNEEIETFAAIAINAKNILNCAVIPGKEDLIDIYKVSFGL
jgi:alcohol dehydrogenase class IV